MADNDRVKCDDCGCWGVKRDWGVECPRCEASAQLNDVLSEKRYLEHIIKKCEEERDAM